MSVLGLLGHTPERLLARIDARVQLKLRKELRRLQRDAGLLFVGLWVTRTAHGDVLVEFGGESVVAPQRYPVVATNMPTLDTFRGADGEEHEAVLYRPRLGRGMPRLGLLAADVRGLHAPPLYDAIEQLGDAVEEILVEAIT
ncbi:MAG: hypothetical protein M5U28_14135 [Sandaracinaceae bacterium]|nr:hypothetical protein [Sandaracinaceae bacterium]